MTRSRTTPAAEAAADDLIPQELEAVEAAPLTPGGLTLENLAAAMGLPGISPTIAAPAIAAAHATIEREMGRAYPPNLPHNLAQARWMLAASLVLRGKTEPVPTEEIPGRCRYFLMLAQGKRR